MTEFPRTLKIITVFGVVFVVLFLASQWWLAQQQRSTFSVQSALGAQVLVIERARDGHYRWPGRIGEVQVNFLVDTGASRTSISQELATQAGLKAFDTARFSTANGQVQGSLAKASLQLEGGLKMERHTVAVMPRMDDQALLGMDVLGKLSIEQSQNQLRIRFSNP
jgi:aspartyl protease family protein